jgi:DNA-binding NtrC family response regulator
VATILIVDDDDAVRETLYELLEDAYECRVAGTTEEALRYLEKEGFDLVLTDLSMPGIDGAALLKEIRLRAPHTPSIVISGKSPEDIEASTKATGVFACIVKPFDLEQVEELVKRAVQK